MANRKVIRTAKNKDGDITGLCFIEDGSKQELHIAVGAAMEHIESKDHSYYVDISGTRTDVVVRKFLTTNPDSVKVNNLDNLPDCSPAKK